MSHKTFTPPNHASFFAWQDGRFAPGRRAAPPTNQKDLLLKVKVLID